MSTNGRTTVVPTVQQSIKQKQAGMEMCSRLRKEKESDCVLQRWYKTKVQNTSRSNVQV